MFERAVEPANQERHKNARRFAVGGFPTRSRSWPVAALPKRAFLAGPR